MKGIWKFSKFRLKDFVEVLLVLAPFVTFVLCGWYGRGGGR